MKKIVNILLMTLMIVMFIQPAPSYAATGDLSVHFLNVGQGDAIFIQAPNGKTMLIDGGPSSAGKEVVAYLQSKKVKKLDYVIATHPDADHIGGLIDVIKNIKITNFIDSGKVHTSNVYKTMLKEIEKKKDIKYKLAKKGTIKNFDKKIKVNILHADKNAKNTNDASIIVKLTYNKISFLFMADAGEKLENKIAKNNNVSATYLKVAHHGSSSGTSQAFLKQSQTEKCHFKLWNKQSIQTSE